MNKIGAVLIAIISWVVMLVILNIVSFMLFGKPLTSVLLPYGALPSTLLIVAVAWGLTKSSKMVYRKLTTKK